MRFLAHLVGYTWASETVTTIDSPGAPQGLTWRLVNPMTAADHALPTAWEWDAILRRDGRHKQLGWGVGHTKLRIRFHDEAIDGR